MKRSIRFVLPLLLIALTVLSLPVSAKTVLTDGVSLLNVNQHVQGPGFGWDNLSDTLTLDGLNLMTADDYGFKIPDGATVVLKGKNHIKASVAALYIGGNVIFRGSGSLILEGGEYGILCRATDHNRQLTITDGTYTILGGIDGIRSDDQKVALSGGKITVTGTDGYAVNARELRTGNNVTVKAVGSFRTSYSMLLQGSNLTIESKEPALISDKLLKLDRMTLKAGSSLDSLTSVDAYQNETALLTHSTFDGSRRSMLFGDAVPFFVDVIVLIAVLLLLAAVVVLPILYKRKKTLAAVAARDAAEAEAKRLKKLNKKKTGK